MLKDNVFRAYDIRGVAERDFQDDDVIALGFAFGQMVNQGGGSRVCVGHDCRLSGERLYSAFCEGVLRAGIDVFGLGMVGTPISYFAEHHYRADGAVSITGSHNPSDWNGFKFSLFKSAMFGDGIQQLRLGAQQNLPSASRAQLTHIKPLEAYLEYVLSQLKPLERDVHVICDAGNGMAGSVAPELYRRMGAQVSELYCEPDGRFPNHHPDPTELHNLDDLRTFVQKEKADVGLAFDGDADRLGVISADGRVVWGDQLLLLFAQNILKSIPGAQFLAEVKCSETLFEGVRKAGGRIEMGKVGHSLIKARMKETGAVLAGEMSGHLFFQNRFLGFDDGIYAGARLLALLGRNEANLSTFLDQLPKRSATPEIRIDCDDEIKFGVVDVVTNHFRDEFEIIDVDGMRLKTNHGWVLLRASNTQPALVMRVEADSDHHLQGLKSMVQEVVQEKMAQMVCSS